MDLLDSVRRTIRRHHLTTADSRVLAAVSGGSDSVALALILAALDAAGELHLVGLLHFNHQLRAEADADERVCASLAEQLRQPFVSDREDVALRARREHRSLEDAGRRARHEFFERARVECRADVVAVGHTRDDQAETFLLRLLRGAGSKGLASMHPRRGAIIRPLLDTRRAELKAYLERRQVSYISDASNDDVNIPRNRVRAELLPFLARRFNPSIVDVLADEAEIAREEYWYLKEQADEWLAQSGRRDAGRWLLDADRLATAPRAVARHAVQAVLTEVSGGRPGTFEDIERTVRLARGRGEAFDGPGQRVERIGPHVVLTGRLSGRSHVGRRSANLFEYPLSIPGVVQLAEVGGELSAEVVSAWHAPDFSLGAAAAVVQLGRDVTSLRVRNRRVGDRFQPLGLGGWKKLQDFFVDRKVARSGRDDVPIVVDDAGRIIWVAGHAIDDAFRVKDPAQTVIILRLKGVGGSA